MFAMKHADPSRRTPTYLQARTQENLVWQLKLTVLFISAMCLKDWWDDRDTKKRARKNRTL